MFSVAEIWPHSQWNLCDFFSNFEKKSQSSLGFSFSQHTHMLHGNVLLKFNGNSMCNSSFVFLLTKNDIIVQYITNFQI